MPSDKLTEKEEMLLRENIMLRKQLAETEKLVLAYEVYRQRISDAEFSSVLAALPTRRA